jgi:hypothetical protein
MIISHKHKFIWFFLIGHTASASIFHSLRELYDDVDYRVGIGHKDARGYRFDDPRGFRLLDSAGRYIEDCGLYTAPKELHKHSTPLELLDSGFDKKKFDEYLKIAVCRNPYTWMGAMARKNESVERYSRKNLQNFWDSRWIVDTNHANGQIPLLTHIDKIIHFEKLQSEWEVFKTAVGIKISLPLHRIVKPHERSSPRIDYIENYSMDGFEFVNETCAQDFRLLGYRKREI